MEPTHIEGIFVNIGGHFLTPAFDLKEKMPGIKAYIFDWDGVFNNGRKNTENSSDFSEVDSMGVNILRFGHFLYSDRIPFTAIITGEINPAALRWAEREHIQAVYIKIKEKNKAILHFCDEHHITPSEVCYFFDDILDIPVIRMVRIRLAIKRNSSPVLTEYLKNHNLVDYFSGNSADVYAIRELCELLLCLIGKQFEVIDKRAGYHQDYQNYIQERQKIETKTFEYSSGFIIQK